MQNNKIAFYSLIASSVVLAGLLFAQVQTLLPAAHAEMVLNRGSLTMLTAPTADGEESLFIIDSRANVLLIYQTDMGQKRLELKQSISLADVGNTARGGSTRTGR